MTTTIVDAKLNPNAIAYSQCSIAQHINRDDGLIGAPVNAWKNEKPYTIAVDVVEIRNSWLCSFDNRRLYAARNHSPEGYMMNVNCHGFSDIVSEEKLDSGTGAVFFWWVESNGLVNKLHELEITIIHWGVMTSYGCACQSPSFSLNGTHSHPEVLRCSPMFIPYYKARRYANKIYTREPVRLEDGINNLLSAISNSDMKVGFSQNATSHIMIREDSNQLISQNASGLRVRNYNTTENMYIDLKAEGDKDDEYWQDQEIHHIQCERMNEIERRWIECDIEEVKLNILTKKS
jgi:hypothetical protein